MASSIAKGILFKKEQTHGENPSHLILGGNVSTIKWSFTESKGEMCEKLPIHPTGSQIDFEVLNVSPSGAHNVCGASDSWGGGACWGVLLSFLFCISLFYCLNFCFV